MKTSTHLFGSCINSHLQYIFFSNLSLLRGNISISCLYYCTGLHYQPLKLFSKKYKSDPTEKPSLESPGPHDKATARQANSSSSFQSHFYKCFLDHLIPLLKDAVCSFVVPLTFYSTCLLTSVLHPSVHSRRQGLVYLPGGDDQRPCTHREF